MAPMAVEPVAAAPSQPATVTDDTLSWGKEKMSIRKPVTVPERDILPSVIPRVARALILSTQSVADACVPQYDPALSGGLPKLHVTSRYLTRPAAYTLNLRLKGVIGIVEAPADRQAFRAASSASSDARPRGRHRRDGTLVAPCVPGDLSWSFSFALPAAG